MATLVLTTVGTALGGPIGGAIGAIIGQQVDGALFAPKARHGPRLGDLAVQTSSYGTQIPKIFGTMRVSGTVIWATDIKEQRSESGGGKGQPKSVNYSYSASFAVALSGRPIGAIRRIWADGKLLRGAAGDFKSATKFRFYQGSEDQAVDALIASAEGVGAATAFRGIAYAVFEDLQLADYGNHIPSLSFEVVAEEVAIAVGEIAEELSQRVVIDGGTPAVRGFAASGDSIRGALEALFGVTPLSVVPENGRLVASSGGGEPLFLAEKECGAAPRDEAGRSEFLRRSAASVACEVSLAYHDVERDYQTGIQRATQSGAGLGREQRAFPGVLQAGEAKALAETRLAGLWAARAGAIVHVVIGRSIIRPGMHVRIQDHSGVWKVENWTLEGMVAELALIGVPAGGIVATGASPGRAIAPFDAPIGPTVLRLFDLPSLAGDLPRNPRLLAVAAGSDAGWRRADLMASYDEGASWTAAGVTAAPAVMGTAMSVLGAGGSAIIDTSHSVEVDLLNDSMWLEGRADDALIQGANLAVLGDELIQFGRAEPLGQRRFRLSRLLRGRRGTEWAASTHSSGEAFALIEAETALPIEAPAETIGSDVRVIAQGIGDGDGTLSEFGPTGEALRPPAPVHLRASRHSNGDISIEWVRRSRNGWTWLSGVDVPLGEEREAYRLMLSGVGFQRSIELTEPHYLYTAGEQAADGTDEPLGIWVVQLGTSAMSRPASLIF